MSKKLIIVLGVTGNQGGSVARRFHEDPNYRIRGITRNPDSPTAQKLASLGMEIVSANLDDPSTLIPAFTGANVIFTVTNFWEAFFNPASRAQAASQNTSPGKFAYDVEYQQGKNIADAAAAVVDGLDDNGFIVSTLSNARKASGGRHQEVYHFDAKADVFPDYVNEKYPALAAKMSCLQTGCFMTSFKLAPTAYLAKIPDQTFQSRFCNPPETLLPHLDVVADTGPFVHAITQLPAGKTYMAAGTTCTWPEYDRTWSQITGHKCEFKHITRDEMVDLVAKGAHGDLATGREITDMFHYSSDPGYDGGDKEIWGWEDIRKAGIDLKMTSLEEFMKKQDWSDVLNQPVLQE